MKHRESQEVISRARCDKPLLHLDLAALDEDAAAAAHVAAHESIATLM